MMKNTKKNQLLVLAATIVAVLAVGFGIWQFTRTPERTAEKQPEKTPADSSQADDGLVRIEGGTFLMGSPEEERQREADETLHEVSVSSFYLSPTEVSQQEYEAVMGTNPSHHTGADLPVENVTWYDAIAFCNALSEREGLEPVYTIEDKTVTWDRSANGYRLPTEAEWEYASRAGTDTVFTFGNQVHSDFCNFEGSYPYLIEENYVTHTNDEVVTSTNRGETIAVDELEASAFGLHQMEGNVSEWVWDYYGPYDAEDTSDPAGADSGSLRVNRGGGYNDFGKHLRSAYRSATNPEDPDQNLGFRIARNAEPLDEQVVTTPSLQLEIPADPKILVAYYSYTGNTANGAQIMAEALGADLFEIEMAEPYTGNIYEVSQYDLNHGVHPALASQVENMDQYDVILLGYPTWWATTPMPIQTFLESYDFSGKTILPFSSHGGTMFGDSVSDLVKAVPESEVGIGFEYNYSGGSELEENIRQWLRERGLLS